MSRIADRSPTRRLRNDFDSGMGESKVFRKFVRGQNASKDEGVRKRGSRPREPELSIGGLSSDRWRGPGRLPIWPVKGVHRVPVWQPRADADKSDRCGSPSEDEDVVRVIPLSRRNAFPPLLASPPVQYRTGCRRTMHSFRWGLGGRALWPRACLARLTTDNIPFGPRRGAKRPATRCNARLFSCAPMARDGYRCGNDV